MGDLRNVVGSPLLAGIDTIDPYLWRPSLCTRPGGKRHAPPISHLLGVPCIVAKQR